MIWSEMMTVFCLHIAQGYISFLYIWTSVSSLTMIAMAYTRETIISVITLIPKMLANSFISLEFKWIDLWWHNYLTKEVCYEQPWEIGLFNPKLIDIPMNPQVILLLNKIIRHNWLILVNLIISIKFIILFQIYL